MVSVEGPRGLSPGAGARGVGGPGTRKPAPLRWGAHSPVWPPRVLRPGPPGSRRAEPSVGVQGREAPAASGLANAEAPEVQSATARPHRFRQEGTKRPTHARRKGRSRGSGAGGAPSGAEAGTRPGPGACVGLPLPHRLGPGPGRGLSYGRRGLAGSQGPRRREGHGPEHRPAAVGGQPHGGKAPTEGGGGAGRGRARTHTRSSRRPGRGRVTGPSLWPGPRPPWSCGAAPVLHFHGPAVAASRERPRGTRASVAGAREKTTAATSQGNDGFSRYSLLAVENASNCIERQQ